MKITITKHHYDLAVAVPWSTTTCIVAQAVMEATGREILTLGSWGTGMFKGWNEFRVLGGETLQSRFDYHHGGDHTTSQEAVLELLPLEIELKTRVK